MTEYCFYIELTSPIITVEADSKEDAERIGEKYLKNKDGDLIYRVLSNLYIGEVWKKETE